MSSFSLTHNRLAIKEKPLAINRDRKIPIIGVAAIKHMRTCVLNIVTFKGGHLMW